MTPDQYRELLLALATAAAARDMTRVMALRKQLDAFHEECDAPLTRPA